MRWLLLLLMWTTTLPVCAQNGPDSAWHFVRMAQRADSMKNHDLAATLYLEASSRFVDTGMVAWMQASAGRQYVKALSGGDEKEAYRKAIYLGRWNHGRQKTYLASKLADFYLKDRQYDSAYAILRYVERLPLLRRGCGMGLFQFYAEYCHKKALALEGMGLLDSAIRTFLPFALDQQECYEFPYYTHCHVEAGDYHCLIEDFVRMLRIRYSEQQLRTELNGMLETAEFQIEKRTYTTSMFFDATLVVRLLGQQLKPRGTGGYQTLEEATEAANKQKEYLRTTVLWQMLIDENNAAL